MGYAIILPDCDFSTYERGFQVHPVNKLMPNAIHIKGADTLYNENNQTKYNVSFDPLLTSYRGIKWEIVSGTDFASIDSHGMLNAKYYAADADNYHDVTIKASSVTIPSVSETKTVSVKCDVSNMVGTVSTSMTTTPQYNNGASFIVQGYLNGDECNLIRFTQPVSKDTTASKPSTLSDKFTLVDNGDGTATVTILTPEYLHQVQFEAYNHFNTSNRTTITVNVNDCVIINAADCANSAELMAVLFANGKSAESDKMYASEAYVVTSL